MTGEERLFNMLCEEYYEKFNEPYVISDGDSRPLSRHIAILQNCIASGKRSI